MDKQMEDVLSLLVRITPQWLAGFFDGEGCVCSAIRKSGMPPIVVVSLTQKDIRPLSLIALKYPNVQGPRPQRSCFVIEWSGRNCIPVLEAIKDYVVVKKDQVEAGLEIAKMMGAPGGARPTQQNIDRRIELAGIIKAGNARKHA